MANGSNAYRMKMRSIVLKRLILECGINQVDLARATGLAKPTINIVVNRGYIPTTCRDFKSKIEAYIIHNERAAQWLLKNGRRISEIWSEDDHAASKWKKPDGHGHKLNSGRKSPAITPGDPTALEFNTTEVEMLNQEAMRHFKLFKNPFIDDVQKDSDIYMSDEHRYIEAAMLDSARHGGFLAVIGEVGSGKSIMRRKIVEQLRRDGDVLVIYPQIVDKTRLNAASICDAIVMDISDQKPKIRLEQKTRQVQNLLLDRSKSGYRACLIIEEAHDLNPATLKYLKRFYELEDGYKKLLGIILIGQTELKHYFNEAQHVEMREVIRRCQVAEIKGLNGGMREYLALKLKRVGADIDRIFDKDALDALAKRLTSKDRQDKVVSHAYPLMVNNYTARAMNMAYETGEERVTEAVVMAI